ncbi:MAG: alpha/beta fold hydrolase [Candidatus Thorarchaeota archaeon]|nr:alpha/beta fold hydrolase [Candidatus Thorarchaeota archaeon]
MIYKETKYIGYDGTRMFMALWRPDDDKPKALILALHGLGGHGGDMRNIGEFLAERGLAVFAPDLRGFGHYSGTKGHVMNFDEYIEDIENLVMQVKDTYLNKITYIFGASLGGLNAIRYVVKYPRTVDGLLLECPAVSQKLSIGAGKQFVGKILSALNVKRYVVTGVEYEKASRNPDNVKRLQTDPLRVNMVTPRFGIEALRATKDAFLSAKDIVLPVLLQQAGDDNLVVPEKSKEFFENLSSADKTWYLYDGLYHQLHEEPEKDKVLGDLYNWLDKRLPA